MFICNIPENAHITVVMVPQESKKKSKFAENKLCLMTAFVGVAFYKNIKYLGSHNELHPILIMPF